MVSQKSGGVLEARPVAEVREPDLDLRRRVVSFLADSNMPGLRQLHVAANDGVVTLSGRVRTYYEKQLSQQRCRRVAGVIQLIDKVDVSI